MSFITTYGPTETSPNWLASEIGLTPKTQEMPQSIGVLENDKRIVPNGTIFPANDATAIGIVYTDVDVTSGNKPGAVVIAGRVWKERLPVAPSTAAIDALEAQGLYFDSCPEHS